MQDKSYRQEQEKIEGIFESDKTISHIAYEEARKIDDTSYLPELYEYIKNTKDADLRRNAIYLLGHIGKNTKSVETADFLLSLLCTERNTQEIVLILNRLEELFKPSYLNLSIIKELCEKRGTRIRVNAYMALTNSEHDSEKYLLTKLNSTKSREDICGIASALSYIGKKESVNALSPFMKSRKHDIKFAVQNSLPTIMIRAKYPITEICRVAKVSTEFIRHRQERIDILTRPG